MLLALPRIKCRTTQPVPPQKRGLTDWLTAHSRAWGRSLTASLPRASWHTLADCRSLWHIQTHSVSLSLSKWRHPLSAGWWVFVVPTLLSLPEHGKVRSSLICRRFLGSLDVVEHKLIIGLKMWNYFRWRHSFPNPVSLRSSEHLRLNRKI